MPGPVLYSTNSYLKLLINERFRGDVHYVWCSEVFDSTKQSAYSASSCSAPSSDPCAIYRQLAKDVQKNDRHSAKIEQTKTSLNSLAIRWRDNGDITDNDAEEILYIVNNASFAEWRPLIYVIPRAPLVTRLSLVTPDKRASIGTEFIIPDLARKEFDIIEW